MTTVDRILARRLGKRRGAMAAELAVLVMFVYVPLVFGAIYIGWLAVGRQRVLEANHYALLIEGDQSEPLAVRGEVSDELFREFTGDVRVEEGDADQPDIPAPDEIRKLFEKWTEKTYYAKKNVSAHGWFELVGSRVVYREVIRVTYDEGWHMDPEGHIVEGYRLLDDQIPERITDLLVDYIRRRRAKSQYVHRWYNDRDRVVAGDQDVEGWNLKVPTDQRFDTDPWRPECAVRWTKRRMARDQSPPGASLRLEVQCPLTLPNPEPSFDYWHPCEGTEQSQQEDLPGPVEGL